ncbi:MAG: 50S ribosomal protein L30 [Candidatus Aenigmarchaeota archaeon]|nr:50S ribosomal protein L30 [Candidatus Aenigmarchaeota archaeon]
MYAVIRIKGKVGTKKEIEDTMKMLNLNKKHTCVLVPENPEMIGMLNKLRSHVTWGKISEEILSKMIEKRGRLDGNKRIDDEFLKNNKIKNFKVLSENIIKGKTNLKSLGIKPYFRLSPPSKGFKYSIKRHYPRGALGDRKEKINELLKKMI